MNLLRLPDVLKRVPVSRAQLYLMMNEGKFPKPIKFGGADARAIAWADSEIDRWIEQRLAERDCTP